MTHIQKMLEELERRNYSQSTVRAYRMTICDLERYCKRPAHQLTPERVRQYQAHLLRDRKLAANTVNQRTGALRFFFIKTLRKPWTLEDTPYPRQTYQLPRVLSQEDVGRIIDAAPTPFYRLLVMALYATGARRAELARLKISDIDSRRMVIHIQGGKGRKDRDVMLSPTLLEALREHWRRLRRKPKTWLFPGNRWHTGEKPIDTKVIWMACKEAAKRAGLAGLGPQEQAALHDTRSGGVSAPLPAARFATQVRSHPPLRISRASPQAPAAAHLFPPAVSGAGTRGREHHADGSVPALVAMPVLRRTNGRDRKTDGSATPAAISAHPPHNSGMITLTAVHLEIQCCYGSITACVSADVHRKSSRSDQLSQHCPSAIHDGVAKAALDTISILRKTS